MENCGRDDVKIEREVIPKSILLTVLLIIRNVAKDSDNLSKKSDKKLCEMIKKKPCDNEYILRDEGYIEWQLIALGILKSRHPLKFDDETLRKAVKLYRQDTNQAEKLYGPISCWDVSQVTNMNCMFYGCMSFNADLSHWDVSQVTNMNCMFFGCESFNSDLSRWDVSQVTTMHCMFYLCHYFNCDLSEWDVSKVTDMTDMLWKCNMDELPEWWYKQ